MKILILTIIATGLLAVSHAAKPNIVLILTDDMGYGDVSCYNPGSKIPTLFMDSLAREGMRFTNAHAPSAVCTPTRYGILTGRYCWRGVKKTGVVNAWDSTIIEHDRINIASMLKASGYATGIVGKWHLGLNYGVKDTTKPQVTGTYPQRGIPKKSINNVDFTKPLRFGPREYGFSYSYNTPGGVDGSLRIYIENGMAENPKLKWGTRVVSQPGFSQVEALPIFLTKAKTWMRKQVTENPEQPFCFLLTVTSPHIPIVPKPEFKGKSKAGGYGDFIVQTDWIIGQLMNLVDTLKIKENTLFIVTSDNGPAKPQTCPLIATHGHYSSADLRGFKTDNWEGGHRIPFIVRWPGSVPAGSVSNEEVCLTDLLATFAAIVGYNLPSDAGEDSYSILPALLGKPFVSPLREGTVLHSGGAGFAIHRGRWTFIDGQGSNGGFKYSANDGCPTARAFAIQESDPPGQLYDMESDYQQKYNLYAKYPDIVKSLDSLLEVYKTSGRSHPLVRNDAFFDDLTSGTARQRAFAAAVDIRIAVHGSTLAITGITSFSLSLYDLSGKKVFFMRSESGGSVRFPSLRNGLYIAEVISSGKSLRQQVCLMQ